MRQTLQRDLWISTFVVPPIALNKIIFAMFFGIKYSINQARNSYIYKSLCKCLHNITRYKTGEFGVYRCY